MEDPCLLTSPRLRDALSRAKAAKVGKGGLVIWNGLLVCWGWDPAFAGHVTAWAGRVTAVAGRAHARSRALSRVFFMVGSQEEEMRIKNDFCVLSTVA